MPRSQDEIIKLLSLIGHGEFLGVLGDNLDEMEKAISDTGKAAEMTIKLKIAPQRLQ